jgi:hypothetical protein
MSSLQRLRNSPALRRRRTESVRVGRLELELSVAPFLPQVALQRLGCQLELTLEPLVELSVADDPWLLLERGQAARATVSLDVGGKLLALQLVRVLLFPGDAQVF